MAQAEKKIKEIDQNRALIREYFEKGPVDNSKFDIILNYMTIAEEDIISIIVNAMELRNMI